MLGAFRKQPSDAFVPNVGRLLLAHSDADARRPELIPSLYDADVIVLGGTGAVISGIERVPAADSVVEFAQSCFV